MANDIPVEGGGYNLGSGSGSTHDRGSNPLAGALVSEKPVDVIRSRARPLPTVDRTPAALLEEQNEDRQELGR